MRWGSPKNESTTAGATSTAELGFHDAGTSGGTTASYAVGEGGVSSRPPWWRTKKGKISIAGVITGVIITVVLITVLVIVLKKVVAALAETPVAVTIGSSPVSLPQGGYYSLQAAGTGQVFMLVRNAVGSGVYHGTPGARSYDGNNWEPVFPLLINFTCSGSQCAVRIPKDSVDYTIIPVTAPSRTDSELIADFLIQATFGPNRQAINSFPSGTSFSDRAKQWVANQVALPVTSHRAYYRQRVNPFFYLPGQKNSAGVNRGPCEAGSRWQRAAFDFYDSGDQLSVVNGTLLYVNNVFRTEVSSNFTAALLNVSSGPWTLCTLDSTKNAVGARVFFYTTGSSSNCTVTTNFFYLPAVNFTTTFPAAANLLFTNNANLVPLTPPINNARILNAVPSNCVDPGDFNAFGSDASGVWYKYQPHLRLVNNSFDQPATGTYNRSVDIPYAPKTFLNEKYCTTSFSSKPPTSYVSSLFALNDSNLVQFYALSGVYAYYVTGLTPDTQPCKSAITRFKRVNGTCSLGTISNSSLTYLSNLIQAADTGLVVVDVSAASASCGSLASGIQILVNGTTCWQHVHQDEYNVFDFTLWTLNHPGGGPAITQFALNGSANIQYPATHDMTRWDFERSTFSLLGTYGKTVDFLTLPTSVQQPAIAQYLNAVQKVTGTSVAVEYCGSPGEVENNPFLGSRFPLKSIFLGWIDFYDVYNYTGIYGTTKRNVWMNIALFSPDQLRQRVAWALAQIFVVSQQNIDHFDESETFLNYYDIFVRNAFGNYFDVMKQVSYSGMMGTMLTYLGVYSYQRSVEVNGFGNYPDENYARELMQLFSLGLNKLNRNGTVIYNADGTIAPTYTITDIESFARIWTGFNLQSFRGNIENNNGDLTSNYIDPMKLVAISHDTFPKHGLDDAHIGDGYPLCRSLPARSFLRMGAKYRFLGSSFVPFVMAVQSNLTLDSNSKLYSLLCNADAGGTCHPQSVVTLTQNLDCYGVECNIDIIRTVTVYLTSTTYVNYEYVQMPCVELEFPEQPASTTNSGRSYPLCVDKRSVRALPTCCSSTNGYVTKDYPGELMTYATAAQKCAALNRTLCANRSVSNTTSTDRLWYTDACWVNVQIYNDGRVGVVHVFNASYNTAAKWYGLNPNSNIVWEVNWAGGNFPNASAQCASGCTVNGTTCICSATASSTVAFTGTSIPSVSTVLSTLFVGAPNPSMFDSGTYTVFSQNSATGLTIWVDSSNQLNANSIFQVVTTGSRTRYFANIIATVQVGSGYSFRNPPNFMQHNERTFRDASNEVDALLYHLLYNPTAAPFIANFMILRFTSSNPSPNYVDAVASAFMSGSYMGIGSGVYGDLSATIAAVLLYRDGISSSLKSDMSHGVIREPVIKLAHLMRSLEIVSQQGREVDVQSLYSLMGEEPYYAPSVFSFYQSQFQPAGAVANTGLYAPEAQLFTAPQLLSTANAIFSLIEFGLSNCFNGFGYNLLSGSCSKTGTTNPNLFNSAYWTYQSFLGGQNASSVVDTLDMLLSGGRLDPARRQIMINFFNSYNSSNSNNATNSLTSVLNLFTTTPEFHVTSGAPNITNKANQRATYSLPNVVYDDSKYQAIVYLFLVGGADSYSLIVPHSGCTGIDLYQQYAGIRTDASIAKANLLPINASTTTQPCATFGVNPNMPNLQTWYNNGEAAFIANIGTLVQPLTLYDYKYSSKKKPYSLFAHNIQQQEIRNLNAADVNAKGVLGRIQDSFTRNGRIAQAYSVAGTFSKALEGAPGVSTAQDILDPTNGVTGFDQNGLNSNLYSAAQQLTVQVSDSVLADTFNLNMKSSMEKSQVLKAIISNTTVPATVISSLATLAKATTCKQSMPNSLGYVAKIIASRAQLKASAHMFNVELGGFDTHFSFTQYGANMQCADSALKLFVDELKRQGIWNNVTIVVASDFARTLGSNGQGTDHAWGGNTFVLGGSVKGGQILGQYPSDLSDSGGISIGNGRMLPTTSWEALWNGVCEWFGVNPNDLNTVLPNRKNFFPNNLFYKSDLFR
eukprot:TRINITY_DN1725_c0_g1_i1.p1 TRINITY_DN1725_c0_g1~~TRINITY_DN1725_c0_g1_i1.p1  ORF type:complete len:2015 (+),score=508.39 TRINITY_DN1725_c0_g1_i1:40-6084(+)